MINISPAALESGAKALHAQGDWSHIPWEELEDCDRDYYKAEARTAFTAIIEAWPGAYPVNYGGDEPPFFVLPLPPQEK